MNQGQNRHPGDSLRLLNHVQPQAGMNTRIHRRLGAASALPARVPLGPLPRFARSATAALALAALLALLPLWHSHPAPTPRAAQHDDATVTAPLFSPQTPSLAPAHPVRAHLRKSAARTQPRQRISFPAPPAPLTHDERILLQMSNTRPSPALLAGTSLLHALPAETPGERLPSLPREIPGHPLPTLAAQAPGHPLPTFFEATKTGDQP